MTLPLPRFVVPRNFSGGRVGLFWVVAKHYRKQGCTIPNEPLGTDYSAACRTDGKGGKAAILNALFDEWRAAKNGEPLAGLTKIGSVAWLFKEYKRSNDFAERVRERTRPDYDRLMQLVANLVTKQAIRSATGTFDRLRRARPTRFTSGSLKDRRASACAKAKR